MTTVAVIAMLLLFLTVAALCATIVFVTRTYSTTLANTEAAASADRLVLLNRVISRHAVEAANLDSITRPDLQGVPEPERTPNPVVHGL